MTTGHVFVMQGDLRQLACDDWLVPASGGLHVSSVWWTEKNAAYLANSGAWNHRRGPRPAKGVFLGREEGPMVVPVKGWDLREGPRPWLVDTVGPGPEWCAAASRAFVDTVMQQGRRRRLDRSHRLLALPVIGTGGGGQRHTTGEVLAELLPALQLAARENGVDIALVTRSAADLAAAQHVRRKMGESMWLDMPTRMRPVAKRLARRAAAGQLVLFLGAGVSLGAGLPNWDDMLLDLAAHAGLDEDELRRFRRLHVLDRAQYLAQRLTHEDIQVGDAVAEMLAGHQHYGLAHGLLAGLPWEEAVTTNYDQLFELACGAIGHPLAVLPYTPTTGIERWLLKMHGCLSHPEDIVLTRQSYLRYAERNAALAGIVQAMLITKHMFFLGFSLRDDNFLRIVDAVRRAVHPDAVSKGSRHRLGSAMMLFRDPLLESLWQGEVDWICAMEEDEPAGADAGERYNEAGRQVEILLDRVGMLAGAQEHLLDRRFAGALSPEDDALAALLAPLLEAGSDAKRAAAWPQVRRLLERLGGKLK